MSNKQSKNNSEIYKVELLRGESPIWSYKDGKKRFALSVVGVCFAILFVSYLIFALTPLKKLIPGYPTEKERREKAANSFKLDSLEREIALWHQQLQNIQLITSGHEPVGIKSDSAYIEFVDAANAEFWRASEAQLRDEVEQRETNKNVEIVTE